jgi:secretion/DNA translocation related TadE-like protein
VRPGERGSASVWVVALAGVLALVGLAAALVGVAAVARHRASAAADLAALAAAGSAVEGAADPCAAASTVAGANGAAVRTCTVDGAAVADVAVGVRVALGPLGLREATARARAGPVTGPAGSGARGGGEVLVHGPASGHRSAGKRIVPRPDRSHPQETA